MHFAFEHLGACQSQLCLAKCSSFLDLVWALKLAIECV